MKLLADSSLPHLDRFDYPFVLTRYSNLSELKAQLPTHDILLCRSTLRVNAELLANSTLQCVATASSGMDHIDQSALQQRHIQLLTAKGCNAHAVSDYILACLAWLITHQYVTAGPIGIIGAGEVGTYVAKRLNGLHFTTKLYDPLKQHDNPNFQSCDLDELTTCRVILVHANLHTTAPYPSRHLINTNFLNQLQPGCVIINAARGELVDEQALLQRQDQFIYCTDVYHNEPDINSQIVDAATLCTPHIAGHSIEGKFNAVDMLLHQLSAHYGYAIPNLAPTPLLQLTPQALWYQSVLEYYNPAIESMRLKQAIDKSQAFKRLRIAHNQRHDFSLSTESNCARMPDTSAVRAWPINSNKIDSGTLPDSE
jgi:erythronate-4-phosphate dehydrogenase